MKKVISTQTDQSYLKLEQMVSDRVTWVTKQHLYETDAENMFSAYLDGLPAGHRQHYNCHACRRFIRRYGGLVTIGEDGVATPALWGDGFPSFFQPSVWNLHRKVASARVTGVYFNADVVWGYPITGPWTHLHGSPRSVYRNPLKTAAQAAAERREDYVMLRRGLAEYPREAVVQALRVLEADAVDRSEKALAMTRWLLELHERSSELRGTYRDNWLWTRIAPAPPGWCHVKTMIISTLLDDIVAGLEFTEIRRRWNEKVHPLQYMRPTVLKEGNVQAANKIVERLGSAGSLTRRFARLDDVLSTIWLPRAEEIPSRPSGAGAFDHLLKRKGKIKEVQLPWQDIAWDKFRDSVLSTAVSIECYIPGYHAPFFGLVTAVDPSSPPILQWDGLEVDFQGSSGTTGKVPMPRNPTSWYFYNGGSTASQWNLVAKNWVHVSAIFLKPCHWQRPDLFRQHSDAALFALEGARDMRHVSGGGFFPECLRSEYHQIKAAMEAYAQRAPIQGREEGDANGVSLDKGSLLILRVKGLGGGTQEYNVVYS